MAISNLMLTQQIYSEEKNGAHEHYREPVPLNPRISCRLKTVKVFLHILQPYLPITATYPVPRVAHVS